MFYMDHAEFIVALVTLGPVTRGTKAILPALDNTVLSY